MNTDLLKLLAQNARYTCKELALMTGCSEEEAKRAVSELEKSGLIRGYKTVVDWDSVENPYVSAIVELKVVPKADLGFEDVARKVSSYKQVESVYLMSGAYDLSVVVKDKTLQRVANFVAKELATIESVTSTSTHFVMRRYKELDVVLCEEEKDDRGQYLL